MAKEKIENYTAEQVQEMVSLYTAVGTSPEKEAEREAVVQMLKDKYGKKAQSIRQKLVKENVYVAKRPKNKAGGRAETKKTVIAEIQEIVGFSDTHGESLELGGKPALQAIRDKLVELTAKPEPEQAELALDSEEASE